MGGRHSSGRLTLALLAGGAALAVAQGGPGLTALAPVRRLFPRLAGAGQPDHVALTFDDGPDPRFTPRLLATLDARRVHATFFLLGPMVQAAPGLAAEIASAGHEIAVHGWEHRYATLRGPGVLHDDLARACDTIAAATGAVPRLYRPPYGVLSAGALIAARRLGLRPIRGVPGDVSGLRGPRRDQCRRPWPAPSPAGRPCSCTIPRPLPPPARRRRRWARCPGCWTSAAAAGCGRAAR